MRYAGVHQYTEEASALFSTTATAGATTHTLETVTYAINALTDQPTALFDSVANRTPLAARRALCAQRGRAPFALPPPVVSTPERQACEEVDDQDHVIGCGPDSEESTPAETAIATIPIDGHVHDIAVSPDGEHVYVARSDSVVVINGRHHIVGRIRVSGPPKSLVMAANGKQLFVVYYDGSVLVVDTLEYTAQTHWGGCASDVVVSSDGRHLYAAHNQDTDGGANGVVSAIDIACATTVATVPVNDVAALAISPDGSRVYAISCDQRSYYQYPAGWLTIIDTASHAAV
jgi:DNA-binding beta-propeller fold protein YncE